MIRLIIAGSRFDESQHLIETNYAKLKDAYATFAVLYGASVIEIVSGGARGFDRLGERLAHEYGIPLKRFPADWDTFGKRAGYMRNAEMGQYGNGLLAMWDGSSRGTKHMIDFVVSKQYPYLVCTA